jgi:anti-anti-sigma factor
MKIKIWGARGSIPAPVKPQIITEKVMSALLGLADVTGRQRDELLAVLIEPRSQGEFESREVYNSYQQKRRQVVQDYLQRLSPLAASTAGGNTPCVEIRSGNDLFIIDAGSGIRELGTELMQGPCGRGEGVVHLLFTHPHWDHIQGFPFFRPAFIPGNKIFIYGVHDMENALRRQQKFISFPISLDYMQAEKTFIQIKPNETLTFGDLRIRNICNQHPGDAYSFRFEKTNRAFVYASDSSYPDGMDMRPYLNFFAGADLLLFDAQFTQRESDEKEDWGHSSSFMGVEMAQQAKAKNLLLFHYDPTYTDQDLEKILEDTLKFQQNQYPTSPPVNIMIAQEGQTFDFTPTQTAQIHQVPGSKATILKPTGIFDEHVATTLREQLLRAENWPAQLIIDMSAVEMLQVAGLRGLVKLRKEYQSTPTALAAPSLNVRQLIELAGYLDFFAIYPSVHAALNALKARETLSLPGQVLKERYKIEAKIGEGRLGTVFRASDTHSNSPVAIKILSPSFSETAIEQFLRQARQIVNLTHPNIVNVYDCDEDRGISFMAEEFIGEQTLRGLIDEHHGEPLPYTVALGIAHSVVQALEYAHSHGVVHGDLKPKNVLLTNGAAKISDFGLGRLEGGKALINIDVPLALVSTHYLAPEQIMGQDIEPQTDLYALGVILYEMFTGSPPFTGSDQEIVEHHRSQAPLPLREINARISRPLEHLILKLLDKDPDKRSASARHVRLMLNSMTISVSRDRQPATFTPQRFPAMVGRASELDQLELLWEKSRDGEGQVVIISGASGVGKTRLVQEIACHLHDATVLAGDTLKQEGLPAYYPFITALETYFSNTPAEVAAENIGYVWRHLTGKFPEITRWPRSVTLTSQTADFTDATQAIQEEVPADKPGLIEVLRQTTSQRPWLVIIDHLQWIDLAGLNLFEYLARHADQLSIMLVGMVDNSEPISQPLQATLELLETESNFSEMHLTSISKETTRHLLENIWGQSVPNGLIAAIFNRTHGNPLFVEAVAFGLVETGVINWSDEKWHFGPVMEAGLPSSIQETLAWRVKNLSRETQTLLAQAAVLGSVFRFDDLSELSDLSEWDALESINTALEYQLLKTSPGEQLLRFSHPLIQQVLYTNLSPLKQRLLHREAGEALEKQHIAEPKVICEWLAHHFLKAGEYEKALIYSIQAAAQANTVYAYQSAMRWHAHALDTADQLGLDQTNQKQRFMLLLSTQAIYHARGLRQAQQESLIELRELAQSLTDPTMQARVHILQSRYDFVMGNSAEAVTETQAALIAARQANSGSLESESLIQLANIALFQGKLAKAREHLYAAQIELGPANDAIEARRLNGLGALYQWLGQHTESEQYYRQAVVTSQRCGDRYDQAAYISNLGTLLLQMQEFHQAQLAQEEAIVIARFSGHIQNQALANTRLCAYHTAVGNYDTARHYNEQAQILHRKIESEYGIARDMQVLGRFHLAIRDYVSARDYLGQSLEIFQHTRSRLYEGITWLELAMALEGLDHISKACHAYQQVHNIAAELGNRTAVIDADAGLARCMLLEGQPDLAAETINAALKKLPQNNAAWHLRYPIRFYLTAYHVLQAANQNDRAQSLLHQGYVLLQNTSKNIADHQHRNCYLENVLENKELLVKHEALAQAQG